MQLEHPKQTHSVVIVLPVTIQWFVGCILHKQVDHMLTYEENRFHKQDVINIFHIL